MNRKNISLLQYIMLTVSLLAPAACSGNLSVQEAEPDDAPLFSAVFAEEPGTRVTYKDDGTAMKLAWNRDDNIGIWTSDASDVLQSNSRYKADEEASVTSFSYTRRATRIRWVSETAPQSFYACWPWSEERGANPSAVKLSLPSVQSQETANATEHLAANDFMWAAAEGLVKSDSEIGLQFHHAFSVLDLELANDKRMTLDAVIFRCTSNPKAPVAFENASIDLASGALDLSGASLSPEIRLECGFATSWPASSHLYMVINPSLGGETVQVLAVAGGKELLLAEKKVPEGGFPKGKMICLKTNFEVPDEVATKIRDLGELGTANSYIVNKANEYYKFKATVKGNGNVPSELSSVAGEPSIAPKSVLVLWYNTVQDSKEWVEACPILLSSLVLVDGYAYFDTPKKFIPGNVVIAAFAEEGVTCDSIEVDDDYNITNATLLWSWNIWAAEDYDPEASPLAAGGRKLMDRNLGAAISGVGTSGDYTPACAVGNCYQWGRKDPFPHFPDYGNYYPCVYSNKLLALPTWTPVKALRIDRQGSEASLDGQMFGYRPGTDGRPDSDKPWNLPLRTDVTDATDAQNDVYVGYSVRNPYKFISGKPIAENPSLKDTYTWVNPSDRSWMSLWGTEKTLYDPCPSGWRVWSKDEATAFLNTFVAGSEIDPNLHGYMYEGCYFPLTGYGRDDITCRVDFVISSGYTTSARFWSADCGGIYGHWGQRFGFAAPANFSDKYRKGEAVPPSTDNNTAHAACGLSVRCVKE